MSACRILVTGSRDWADTDVIDKALTNAYFATTCTDPVTIIHGACPRGADAIASKWIAGMRNSGWRVAEEPHPADWERYGKSAGFRRNAEMVARGADLCLAFIGPCTKRGCLEVGAHGSHGATHCATQAETAGIEVRRFAP